MEILFCQDPFESRTVDEMWASEYETCQSLEIRASLIDFEALAEGNKPEKAVRKISESDIPRTCIYRGWMLHPEQYKKLFVALQAKGAHLINTPHQYQHCHHFPASYQTIESLTPKSIWIELTEEEIDLDRIMERLAVFGDSPLMLKDYVKSHKHNWEEACYIRSASDRSEVRRVVDRFLNLQDGNPEGGLVFREFVEFEPLATHSKSGMPLTVEYRLFFLGGTHMMTIPYWEKGDYDQHEPPTDLFRFIGKRVTSNFFTMDIAKTRTGEWMIVELGDGQVASLPEQCNLSDFYRLLKQLRIRQVGE